MRRRAVGLLEVVETPHRESWLACATRDPDPTVAAAAVVVRAILTSSPDSDAASFERDFASGELSGDLEWEWEYRFSLCDGLYVPNVTGMPLRIRYEDDALARHVALGRSGAVGGSVDLVAILVHKRFVNRHTRLPKDASEYREWQARGRPRYRE
ncbi:MAG: hypothetical protein U1E26_11035 [Coriobacteriia bacterium]|nr:hypothetical protein [Coriobacteriia bacterium]